ncbi:zinc-ribbon domain-containing protein [Ruegeria profundi]|uniref:zinc-ribbon domain-containing protein n=1 Tax=Ruegeria profundi TaxID=1685378 RepID=UPI003C7B149F
MRLTCPNCGAQYEVPDEVIPEEGRDVQCSACDQTWFQPKHPEDAAPTTDAPEATAEPDAKPEPTPEPDTKVEVVDETPPDSGKTGNVDPAVASILKEEAAREAELRSQEGSSLETQPDLALEDSVEPEFQIKRPTATETAEDAGQKDELPDVETINSGMMSDEGDDAPPAKQSRGFVRGFAVMLIIGVILYLIYGNAQQISEAVPQADPVLDSYVSLIDQARIWLETQAGAGAPQE